MTVLTSRLLIEAHGVQDASKEDVQGVALGIQQSLKNHEGNGIQIAGQARQAWWRLQEAS